MEGPDGNPCFQTSEVLGEHRLARVSPGQGQEFTTSSPSLPSSAPHSSRTTGPRRVGNIEVWNDLVSIRDLLIALAVSIAAVIISCVIATLLHQPLLFWGLGGSAAGFAVNCLIIRPKRDVRIVDDALAGVGTSAVDPIPGQDPQ